MDSQYCGACKADKPRVDFYAGYRNICKPCHREKSRQWHKENPKSRREGNWRNKYGISFTSEQYDAMHESQEGKCAVCGRAESASGRRLAVDHDHRTGAVRGLLCTKCNTTLGWVELHPQIITYLTQERK
jgi:hypothetical protein